MTKFVDSPALRDCWYPVARLDDHPDGRDPRGTPRAVRLLGDDYVVWRTADGGVSAAPDRCPHREAPLSAGIVTGGELECSYHGWRFGADGRCVAVPSSGPTGATPPTARLTCLRAEERYGLVWICPGTPTADIPHIAQEHDPSFRRLNTEVEEWTTSAPRMVDNFMDFSHFPWVHASTFGAEQDPIVPQLELGRLDDDFYGYAYDVEASNPDEATVASGSDADVVHRSMTTGCSLPFTVRSTIRYDDGLEHVLLLCSTPIDDFNSLFTFVVWRNDDHSIPADDILAFDRAIGAEDKVMLERISGTLPLEQTGLVNVQSDKPSVEWRRRFARMIGVS